MRTQPMAELIRSSGTVRSNSSDVSLGAKPSLEDLVTFVEACLDISRSIEPAE